MIIHSQIIKLDNGNIIMNQREQAARGMMSAGIGSLSGLEDTRRDSDPLDGHYIMNSGQLVILRQELDTHLQT